MGALELPLGMGIERDILFEGEYPLSVYAQAARTAGTDRDRRTIAACRGRRLATGGAVMRFRRWPRPTTCEDTPRKRAAYLRKQHCECESLPLFTAIVQVHQHDVETEMAQRAERWGEDERNSRTARAA